MLDRLAILGSRNAMLQRQMFYRHVFLICHHPHPFRYCFRNIRVGGPLHPRVSQDHILNQTVGSSYQDQKLGSKLLKLGHSPINVEQLVHYLSFYPNKRDAVILKDGFRYGFRLNYTGVTVQSDIKNLKSANLHLSELKQKINTEVSLDRMVGPFDVQPLNNFKISPVGLIPKN